MITGNVLVDIVIIVFIVLGVLYLVGTVRR